MKPSVFVFKRNFHGYFRKDIFQEQFMKKDENPLGDYFSFGDLTPDFSYAIIKKSGVSRLLPAVI